MMTNDIDPILEFLAVELLGWERQLDTYNRPDVPLETWKHPDGSISYGGGTRYHLLTGNGMLELERAARDKHGILISLYGRQGGELGYWAAATYAATDFDSRRTLTQYYNCGNYPEGAARAIHEAMLARTSGQALRGEST